MVHFVICRVEAHQTPGMLTECGRVSSVNKAGTSIGVGKDDDITVFDILLSLDAEMIIPNLVNTCR